MDDEEDNINSTSVLPHNQQQIQPKIVAYQPEENSNSLKIKITIGGGGDKRKDSSIDTMRAVGNKRGY